MILGLTGGFGCGKSSVLRFFEYHFWFTLDADAVCRDFYEMHHPLLMSCIEREFGSDMFTSDGNVDRKKLGEILFEYPEKMQLITGVIYPLLTEKVLTAIDTCRQMNKNGVFELPLLYEAGFDKYFDAVMAVWCPAGLRKERLQGRNFSADEVNRRDKMQISPDEKLERADYAVLNTGSREELFQQLEKLLKNIEK